MYGPADAAPSEPADSPAALALLALPAKIAQAGIRTLELCHFHVRTLDPAYLAAVRKALAEAGVTLHCLLIDAGDLTHDEHAARDEAWIARWIEVAGALGAKTARVIGGHAAPSDATLAQSLTAMRRLADVAAAHHVQLVTENFFKLMSTPEAVTWLVGQMNGKLGFKLDFGNWSGAEKYAWLAQVAPLAESCHAKAQFTAAYTPDAADFTQCLDIARAAGFAGPLTLIYDDARGDDEFRGLSAERELAAGYL
jgi:sugar phosphate isomerase/epimerase